MGAKTTTKTTKTEAWVHKPRVASFRVTGTGKDRIFTPVNDRAAKLARKLGKRTRVTPAELRPYKGYYKLRQYNTENKLVAVRV